MRSNRNLNPSSLWQGRGVCERCVDLSALESTGWCYTLGATQHPHCTCTEVQELTRLGIKKRASHLRGLRGLPKVAVNAKGNGPKLLLESGGSRNASPE